MKYTLLTFLLVVWFQIQSQVTDIDGNSYDTVRIGTQTWMAGNLNVSRFRNGDPIPEAKTKEEWIRAGENRQSAWCYYENNPSNGVKYGKLYNWFAVADVRGLAPLGYHVSSKTEWDTLINYVDYMPFPDDWYEGGGDAVKIKSTSDWADSYATNEETRLIYYYNANGNNVSGLNCLPAGCRFEQVDFEESGFGGLKYVGEWWCSDYYHYSDGIFYCIYNESSFTENSFCSKSAGLSVRCIKD